MAAFATTQDGNWSDSATWGGGGVPTSGDTATVVSSHLVIVDVNTIIGDSPAEGTIVLAVNENLVVNAGVTLTLQGDCGLNNKSVTFNAGAALVFDSSLATNPTDQNYQLHIATANFQSNATAIFLGTAENHCSVSSTSGGGNGYLGSGSSNWLRSGSVQAAFTDFTDIGTSTIPAFQTSLQHAVGKPMIVTDCDFLRCGRIGGNGSNASNTTYILERVRMLETLSTDGVLCQGQSAIGTGTRRIKDCYFDKNVKITGGELDITGTFMEGLWSGANNASWDLFENNLVNCTIGSVAMQADASDSFFYARGTNNPHFIQVSNYSAVVVDGVIFDYFGIASNGDGYIGAGSATAWVHTLQNSLSTANAAGLQSTSLATFLGGNNPTYILERNTAIASGPTGSIVVGETQNSPAGLLARLRNNLFSGAAAADTYKITNLNGSPNTDILDAANGDYNSGFNLAAGSEGKGYDTPMTGVPGTNDFVADPGFVDMTRSLATFDSQATGLNNTETSWDVATTYAVGDLASYTDAAVYNGQVVNYRAVAAHTGQTPGTHATNWEPATLQRIRDDVTLIPSLMTFVRSGYAPTNAVFATAAHDGGLVGAVAVVAATNLVPVAANVHITGTAQVGVTLTGSYDYSDAEGDPEGTPIHRWLADDATISGATSSIYIPVLADVGSVLKYAVTVTATAGATPSSEVVSGGTSIIVTAPVAELTHHLPLQETSGTKAVDVIGVQSAGEARQPKRALHFDGVSGTVEFAAPNSLNSATAFAVSIWASATAYGTNPCAVSIRTGTGVAGTIIIYLFDINGGNGPRVYFNNAAIINDNSGNIADGKLHHFLFVSRSSTDHELFVDGVSVGTSSISRTLGASLTNVNVGSWRDIQFHSGDIHDVKIYDASNLPTAQEILDLADPAKSLTTALDTVLHVKGESQLDVAGGAVTGYDSSGNGNHGTATTGVTTVQTADYSFANEVGYSLRLHFDGVNDYVDCGAINPTGSVTVRAILLVESTPAANMRFIASRPGAQDGIDFFVKTDGSLEITTPGGSFNSGAGAVAFDGAEQEVAFVTDGAASAFYVNGSQFGASFNTSISATAADLFIGHHHIGATGFLGIIRGVRIFNYPLAATDIAAIADGTYTGGGDLAWYELAGDTVATVGSDGTLVGSPVVQTIPRNESTPTQDVLGGTLQHPGPIPNDGTLDGSVTLNTTGPGGSLTKAADFDSSSATPITFDELIILDSADDWAVAFYARQDEDDDDGMVLGGPAATNSHVWLSEADGLQVRNEAGAVANYAVGEVARIKDSQYFLINNSVAGTLTLLVDGALVESKVFDGDFSFLYVGSGGSGSTSALDGSMADLRFYKGIPTQAEIDAVVALGVGSATFNHTLRYFQLFSRAG